MKKQKATFAESVNWEYVHAHHKKTDGKLSADAPFVRRIIENARRHGFKGKISLTAAARVANANLY